MLLISFKVPEPTMTDLRNPGDTMLFQCISVLKNIPFGAQELPSALMYALGSISGSVAQPVHMHAH